MEEDNVKFSSNGDAGLHWGTRMGTYVKASRFTKGLPVFKQVGQHVDERPHFLYAGPDGRWRVGPDVASYSNSVLKHPARNANFPPENGWLYYLDDKWREDESLSLTNNMKDERGVPKSTPPLQNKDPSCCTIVEEYEVKEDHCTTRFKHVTCLEIAILTNDSKGVEISIEKGCNVNFEKTEYYADTMTPLMLACCWSSLPIVSLLVEHQGIELDRRNNKGETALMWAARKSQNVDMVKLLVEAGAKIYLRDGEGFCPLHKAVEAVEGGLEEEEKRALEIVKYLHSKGASIHTHGRDNTTPLWTAVSKQNLPMVRYLVENGAKLDSPKCCGSDPFDIAIERLNTEIVRFMIENGADITKDIVFVKICFEVAEKKMIKNGESEWKIENNRIKHGEIIAMLKAAQEDPKNNDVAKNMEDIIKEFASSEGTEFRDISTLGIAVVRNDIEAVKSNLANGSNINCSDCYCSDHSGCTPLIIACEHSSLDIVKLLVEHQGVDLDLIMENGDAALNRAVLRDDNLEMVKLLVEAGADPDLRDRHGYSPLHRAAEAGQLDTVKYLQSKGAWINTSENAGANTTPLWHAAYHGNLELVEYCASQGVPLDAHRGTYGYLPLNAAVAQANVDVVKFLILQGADVDSEGSKGSSRSNLGIARYKIDERENIEKIHLYEEIIYILKEAGAKEPDIQLFNQLVLETMESLMWTKEERFKREPWKCMDKIELLTEQPDQWLTLIESLVDVVPTEHPMGPKAIAQLLNNCPRPVKFESIDNVDTYLDVLEMAKSYDGNDIRHRNMSIIISCIARDIIDIIMIRELGRNPDMLDYLFGNLKQVSNPEVTIFSLLALELLTMTDKNEGSENPCVEIVRKRFLEFSADDHPLLELEKLVDSANSIEKQLGFCARWYLDNLWTIDIPDARHGRIDKANFNTTLTAIDDSEYLKIGPSGLEVRSDGIKLETAKSTVKVDEGSWYYEVTLVTGGLMQIGWATEHKNWDGDSDIFSQSYDGCRQVVCYNRGEYEGPEPNGKGTNSWKPGDVVGLLIDIENQEIFFSLNGVSIVYEKEEEEEGVFEMVKDGFFAVVSLESFQQCQVNFGKDPFKHPPEGKTFRPVNEATL